MSIVNEILSGVEKYLTGALNSAISSSTRGPSTDIVPGDIEILGITLLSEDQQRQYDLMAQVTGIEIFESVLSPVIFAELVVADSIGLYQNFPIIGEEYVSITFRTPNTEGEPANYLFRVNQLNNKVVTENNKMVTYTLQLVSAEIMRNSNKYINNSYEKNINEIVTEIVTEDLTTQKPVSIDKTSGIEKLNVTKMEPFKAIDFLRRRAISTEYESSSFVFYESRNGFVFTTLEKLMSDGQKQFASGASDKEFFFDTLRKDSIKSVNIRNILAYNQLTFNDTISKIQHGGLTNKVSAFDIITGGITKTTYTNNIGADKFKFADNNSASMNTTGFNQKHGKTTASDKFIAVRSDKPSNNLPEKLSKLQAYAQAISQNIVQIHIYGDSEIQVGNMIKCHFPAATSFDKGSAEARLDSGNYLVTKVRHMILVTDRPQHTISLELIKGGLTET